MSEIECLTWNVHRCRGQDSRIDPDRTANVLLDIIGSEDFYSWSSLVPIGDEVDERVAPEPAGVHPHHHSTQHRHCLQPAHRPNSHRHRQPLVIYRLTLHLEQLSQMPRP